MNTLKRYLPHSDGWQQAMKFTSSFPCGGAFLEAILQIDVAN